MGMFETLAEAFRYPDPNRLPNLEQRRLSLPAAPGIQPLDRFIASVKTLTLSQWEEQYTHTFDLNPAVAPYIGFQVWGENYERGRFMSLMNRELHARQIDLDGELPDHLICVLRYLEVVDPPLPEVMEVLVPALKRMHETLGKTQPENPYLDLLEAASLAVKDVQLEG